MIFTRERWIVKTEAVVPRKKFYTVCFMIGFLLCMLFPLPLSSATGTTLYVGTGQTYQTIQAAINAAAAGDTVYVYAGTYTENILIEKELTLTGENRDSTIITYGQNGHIVNIQGSEGAAITVHISGFTIRNALGQGYDSIAGSYMQGGTITNTKLLNSDQSDGVQLYHCSGVTISNNVIMNNKGAGISLTLSSTNTIHSNTIQANQKGIHFYLSSNNNVVYSNTLTSNTQYGIYVVQSTGNQFYLNDFVTNGINAYDPGSNSWSFNQQGNYWSNYNNYDTNGDGIGDVAYSIPGGTNQDLYPLGYFLEYIPNPGGSNQKPTAYQPSITPNPGTFGDPVLMGGSGTDADGWIEGYQWRSSIDGVLSTSSSFTTSSLSEGTHTIFFKVKDNEDTWSTEKTVILTINPRPNQAPTAVIDSIEPNPGYFGKNITLSGHGVDDDGTISEWRWISSIDGELSVEATCTIASLSVGRHTIYFQVRDDDGKWSKQGSQTLTILESGSEDNQTNKAPCAHAGGPYYGDVGGVLVFDGSKSYDEDGTIVEYLWSFGDDSSGTGITCTHSYTANGEYTVVLTIVDNQGKTASNTTKAYIGVPGQSDPNNPGSQVFALPSDIPFFVFILIPIGVIGLVIVVFFYSFKKR